jgi:hypothetical protein
MGLMPEPFLAAAAAGGIMPKGVLLSEQERALASGPMADNCAARKFTD